MRFAVSDDLGLFAESVRSALGGCTGSFVSPEGLVITNHHCVVACVTALSSSSENFVELGFEPFQVF